MLNRTSLVVQWLRIQETQVLSLVQEDPMPRSNQAHMPQLLSPCAATAEACVPRAHLYVPSHFSHVQLIATLWNVAHQVPLSRGFSRYQHWSGFPCPPPGYLPNPGIEPTSLTSLVLANGFFTTSTTWEAPRAHSLQQR